MIYEIILLVVLIYGVYYLSQNKNKKDLMTKTKNIVNDVKTKSVEGIKKIIPFTKHLIKTNIDAVKTYNWSSPDQQPPSNSQPHPSQSNDQQSID